MKLNIGAGTTKIEGFYSCDHTDIYGADFVFDLEKDIFPFEDNSVDEIIIHHVMEHLGEGYFHCLQEMYRICKDGAIIDVIVPHYRNENQYHNPTHKRFITHHGLLLLDQEQTISPTSNIAMQYGINFKTVFYEEQLNHSYPLYNRIKNMPLSELYAFAMDKNNVFNETHVKLQVKKHDT